MWAKEESKNFNRGFAAFLAIILVLAIMFGIGAGIINLTLNEQKISRGVVKSSQSYYAAESGIEDAILRLKRADNLPVVYGFSVGSAWVTTTIADAVGGIKTIVGEGNDSDRIRRVQAVYRVVADSISFFYGAQVGAGGMIMGSNSRVKGNVFSNGSVYAENGTGYINNSIIVANNGNRIEDLWVGGDVTSHTCKDSIIVGKLTYVSGGSVQNCTATSTTDGGPNEIAPQNLPISQSQIGEWKQVAASGGIISNDVVINGTISLGPVQIGTTASPKNLTVNNGDTLKIGGTLYVTGDILLNQNSKVQLDASYGPNGGIVIADGKITIENGTALEGSGQASSYILILSTNNSLDTASPAIYVKNNAQGAIIYTNSGLISLKNLMKAREITGYKVKIENNAEIEYESGLINANFTGGSGGSWQITNWDEVE